MPPIDCEDQELLEGFLTETTELIERLDDDLITLEKASDDTELMNRIFRSIHTIKGASSFLGFDLLVKVTHKTEDVLNRLRKGELILSPEIMDVVLEATDLVKVLVGDIKAGDIQEREIDGTITKLLPFLSDTAAVAPPPEVAAASVKTTVVETPPPELPSAPTPEQPQEATVTESTSAAAPPATPMPALKPATDAAPKKAPPPAQASR